MSKFAALATSGNGTFITSSLKKKIASEEVPFTITSITGPVWNQQMRTNEWRLNVEFEDEDIENFGVSKSMILTFTSVPTSVREQRLHAIEDDLKSGETLQDVVLTFDESIGRNGWYDLTMLG